MEERYPAGLQRMSELNRKFEVADNDSDVRGWHVFSGDGKDIGKVDDLIVDPEVLKVKYLDVIISDDIFLEDDRHIIVPVSYAHIEPKKKHVHIAGLITQTTIKVPRFDI